MLCKLIRRCNQNRTIISSKLPQSLPGNNFKRLMSANYDQVLRGQCPMNCGATDKKAPVKPSSSAVPGSHHDDDNRQGYQNIIKCMGKIKNSEKVSWSAPSDSQTNDKLEEMDEQLQLMSEEELLQLIAAKHAHEHSDKTIIDS